MTLFRVVRSRESGERGWAVERRDSDGEAIVVTRVYAAKRDADREAEKLNGEAARRTMR